MAETDLPSFWTRYLRNFVAGCASGVALVSAGHPFDTIKVRMQTQGTLGKFNGPLDCLKQTINNEGFRGVYKGVSPPLVTTGVINAILFGLQGIVTRQLKADPSTPPTVGNTMQAAVITGALISVIVAPMEGIKARMQVQYAKQLGPVQCARNVYLELGLFRGIYRGWLPTALCRMSNYAYFGPYEYFRQKMGLTMGGSNGGRSLVQSIGASVAAGSAAGVCYWLSCYPIDVIKNRIQAQPDTNPPRYTGMRQTAQIILREQGVRGFFVGFTPCLLRAVPANAAAFSAFELAMYLLPVKL